MEENKKDLNDLNEIKDDEIKKKVEKLNKNFKEDISLSLIEEMLKNNEYEFEYKDIKYKVKKPTFGEKQKAYEKRVEKEIQLLEAKDENGNYKYKSIDDIKKIRKERGIDIDAMDDKFMLLEKKKNGLRLKLGKGLKEKRSKKELKTYRDEISKIDFTQKELTFKKSKYLEVSIESQIDVHVYSYLTYLVSEKLVEGKWVKVWNSYGDFENSPDDLVNKISYHAILIVQQGI